MKKVCTQCSARFEITEDDLAFYERVSPTINDKKYLIPPASKCPDCREQRRLCWRNERFMYRRPCDATGKNIVTMYPPDSPFKIYEQSVWWGDTWDALEYGRDFDFNRPFFEQFRELQLAVPRLALVNKKSENSDYTNHAGENKNCYMSAVTFTSEDVLYSDWIIDHCRDLVDCSYMMEGCELCYETYYAWGAYQTYFSEFIRRCQNVWFCFDCTNCKNCFLCANLRNKEYCIENVQYTKEEYEKKMKEIFPLTHTKLEQFKRDYIRLMEKIAIHPAVIQVQAIDSTGDLLFQTQNCTECFDIISSEDCRHCYSVIDVKDCMDIYHVGWAELMYECHAISNGHSCIACHFTYDNANAMYCDNTQNCREVFGCCGLNQKRFCILNKQYKEKEYFDLVGRIIEHMQKTGEWGEFFPMEFSPFAYNQSRAMEFFPLTKEQAAEKHIRWSDFESPAPNVKKTVPADKLPESIEEVPDDILDWAIMCEVSGVPFQLIGRELEFYRGNGLPVPRRHPNERYKDRFAMRRPSKLHQSMCNNCKKSIQTSYFPNRPGKVFCEECYLKEVY